jgi:hypothetical protein
MPWLVLSKIALVLVAVIVLDFFLANGAAARFI